MRSCYAYDNQGDDYPKRGGRPENAAVSGDRNRFLLAKAVRAA
ncbi:hypothetical protein [Brevibacillus marinus]|nr:hypothetical protein [Brevibacillus marinus]